VPATWHSRLRAHHLIAWCSSKTGTSSRRSVIYGLSSGLQLSRPELPQLPLSSPANIVQPLGRELASSFQEETST
jgi:hypothetical protein